MELSRVHNNNYIEVGQAFDFFASAGTHIRYIITAILLFTIHVGGERAKKSVFGKQRWCGFFIGGEINFCWEILGKYTSDLLLTRNCGGVC